MEVSGGGATLWGLGMTAIWLQNCGFPQVVNFFAETHDLEDSRMEVGGRGGPLVGAR